MIHYGGDRKQTSTRDNAGQNPRWGETFQFMRTGDTVVRVEVWDRDTGSQNDIVGQGQLNIMDIISAPMMGPQSRAVQLYYQGRSAGTVNLSIIPQGGMGMGMPMGGGVKLVFMVVSATLWTALWTTTLWSTLWTTRLWSAIRSARLRSTSLRWTTPIWRRRLRSGMVIVT